MILLYVFFFKQKTAYEMRISDWSSDVCSSDLNSIMTRLESATNRVRMREVYAGPKTQDAFSRFDVLERRVDMAEGRADALSLGAPQKTLDEELAELRPREKVDADLAARKAGRKSDG